MQNKILVMPILFGNDEAIKKEATQMSVVRDALLCSGWQIKETRLIEFRGTVFAHYVFEPYVTYTTDKEDKVVSTKQVEQEDVRSKG